MSKNRSQMTRQRHPASVQSEYVKNLQQQIYLLELETRYLKAGKSGNGLKALPGLPSAHSSQNLASQLSMHLGPQQVQRDTVSFRSYTLSSSLIEQFRFLDLLLICII